MCNGNTRRRFLTIGTGLVCLLGLGIAGCAQWLALIEEAIADANAQVTINIQVDAEREDTAGIQKIVDELKQRGIKASVFVTADYANREAMRINSFYQGGFEIGLHGYYTGEQLASMTYEEQQDLLNRAMLAVRGCAPCGTDKPVVGFRPQYFSQNEDTYRVLDELGIEYNAGYKAGQVPIEGYETARTPFTVPNHNFKAVPFTTVEQGGKTVYLCDIACALVENMTADEWGQLLDDALQQCIANGEPMVVLFHGWYTGDTGQYDYWQPFVDFLDAAEQVGRFVTAEELATN